jgi:SAM-dependent methyltransferase
MLLVEDRVAESAVAVDDAVANQWSCPSCASADAFDFFHIPRLPKFIGNLYSSPESARNAPTGSVTLTWCPDCGLAWNRAPERESLHFEPGFEVQLGHSPTFRSFLTSLADRLVTKFHLYGKEVVDVGCGAGVFLQQLCERGGNSGLGIDPTLRKEREISLSRGRMRLVRTDLGATEIAWRGDFAVCQSVLEVVPNPIQFMQDIGRLVKRRGGRMYLEVFNAARMLQAGETWSVAFELRNYFVLEAFVNAARRAGLRVLEAGHCYQEDQYLYIEAEPQPAAARRHQPLVADAHQRDSIADFARLHQEKVAAWWQRVDQWRAQKARAVVWGSGGKGISFLNTIDAPDLFQAVVDINPARQEKFLGGTGQAIVPPAWLVDHRPDFVVITNPVYEREIRSTVAALGLACEFLMI